MIGPIITPQFILSFKQLKLYLAKSIFSIAIRALKSKAQFDLANLSKKGHNPFIKLYGSSCCIILSKQLLIESNRFFNPSNPNTGHSISNSGQSPQSIQPAKVLSFSSSVNCLGFLTLGSSTGRAFVFSNGSKSFSISSTSVLQGTAPLISGISPEVAFLEKLPVLDILKASSAISKTCFKEATLF